MSGLGNSAPFDECDRGSSFLLPHRVELCPPPGERRAPYSAPDGRVDASYLRRISFRFDLCLPPHQSSGMHPGNEMDKRKLEAFKKRLETRQQELRRMVSRTQQDGRSADEDVAQDIADKAASSYNKEFLFHQSNADRQLLQMVEGALARIREGSFGECISCGKEINPKRLEAVPWTRHCIECQEKLEKGILEEASR